MAKGSAKKKTPIGCLAWALVIIFFPIALSIWFWRSNLVQSKKTKAIILAVVWAVLLIIGGTNQDANESNSDPIATIPEATQTTIPVTEVTEETNTMPPAETVPTESQPQTTEATETTAETETVPLTAETTVPTEEPPIITLPAIVERDYVLNTSTMKIHEPSCNSVDEIKSWNRSDYTGGIDDLIARGYSPCKKCDPW